MANSRPSASGRSKRETGGGGDGGGWTTVLSLLGNVVQLADVAEKKSEIEGLRSKVHELRQRLEGLQSQYEQTMLASRVKDDRILELTRLVDGLKGGGSGPGGKSR